MCVLRPSGQPLAVDLFEGQVSFQKTASIASPLRIPGTSLYLQITSICLKHQRTHAGALQACTESALLFADSYACR